jgi:hypothetical protein
MVYCFSLQAKYPTNRQSAPHLFPSLFRPTRYYGAPNSEELGIIDPDKLTEIVKW